MPPTSPPRRPCAYRAFSDRLEIALAQLLPDGAACSNPVDLAGAGEKDLACYADVISLLLDSDEVDSVVLTGYFGSYGVDTPSLAGRELEIVDAMGAAVTEAGKPLIVQTMVDGSAANEAMWKQGIPVYGNIETAIRALVDADRLARAGRPLAKPAARTDPIGVGYLAAQKVLTEAGIRFPHGVPVRRRTDLDAARAQLNAPYVLKASWLEHKSELGGVRVGLADMDALTEAFDTMYASLGEGDYVVEELDARRHTVEILVGARRDPDLGPIVVVGAGGTEAEVYRDVAVEMAPVDAATARAMLGRLACAPLLRGWRGRPAVDVDALTEAVVAVSEVAASHPRISEIDVNPLRVGPHGVLAVDALIVEDR